MLLRILSGWLCAAAICVAEPAAAATSPGGVYAILVANTPDQYPIAGKALHKAGVDGLLIHLRWSEISPSLMQYDWTTLDHAVRLAERNHKRFELGIETGGTMPGWITAPPPQGLGAQSATFYEDPLSGKCTSFVMAPPYDPAYLKAFRDLLHQLAAHLRATGGIKHLSMLKLFGITTTTDELRMPAITECGHDNVQTWVNLGYSQAKVEGAWKAMLKDYLDFFPKKSFNIGFIGINAFPGIGPNGHVVVRRRAAEKISAAFAARLFNDAGAAMPGRLALGFDSLTLNIPAADKSYRSTMREFLADGAAAAARLGWQTNELLGEYPNGGAACGGSSPINAVPCIGAAQFKRMLFKGIYPKGKLNTPPSMQGVYMEVFPQNVTQFPEALPPTQANLAVWNTK
jgi:hypothetical protein